jgi:hypothetical protein
MDKHANIYFDGNKFAVTDRNGKPVGNTIFNRHRRANAFRDALTANTDSDGNADAFIDAIEYAYAVANGYAGAGTYTNGYAYSY